MTCAARRPPRSTGPTAAGDKYAPADGMLGGKQAPLTGQIKTAGDLGLLKRMGPWFVR